MNTLVNFELAKLLKEKGIKIDTDEVLFYRDEINNIEEHQIKNRDFIYRANFNYIVDENEYQTYIIAEIVMWLYEKHDIWIANNWQSGRKTFLYELIDINSHENTILIQEKNYRDAGEIEFNSPTEAYEAAIEYTLNNLL